MMADAEKSTSLSKSANQQISKSANQQISKSANQQISKSANQQISKSANQHQHSSIQPRNSPTTGIHNPGWDAPAVSFVIADSALQAGRQLGGHSCFLCTRRTTNMRTPMNLEKSKLITWNWTWQNHSSVAFPGEVGFSLSPVVFSLFDFPGQFLSIISSFGEFFTICSS